MQRSTSTSSFLENYENMINILSIENKFNTQNKEKDISLEQNLLWRRRQPLYKIINSSTTSFESLASNFTIEEETNENNKYKYQFECPNSMAATEKKIDSSINLNEKLALLRKQFS